MPLAGLWIRLGPANQGTDMHKIINRTNSPYDLQGKDGNVLLPANGEVVAEFAPDHLEILRACGAVLIEYIETSSPGLYERYEARAGRSADKRWSEKRVADEIEKLEAANANHVQK